ncbi:hypothetical protein GGF44_005992, partial [Coemansia sp. RSA 1694]
LFRLDPLPLSPRKPMFLLYAPKNSMLELSITTGIAATTSPTTTTWGLEPWTTTGIATTFPTSSTSMRERWTTTDTAATASLAASTLMRAPWTTTAT